MVLVSNDGLAMQPKVLTHFMAEVPIDERLLPTHVSLFTALFFCYHKDGDQMPFSVKRQELMQLSSIRSISTYHRCMKDLREYGYIRNLPSYDSRRGSAVYFIT